jgi:hypothetical protein
VQGGSVVRAPGWRRAACVFFVGLCGLQVVLGAVCLFENIDEIPRYGDTVEYVRLSKSLEIDSWRTVAYPLVIRGASLLCEDSFHVIVYILQLTLFLIATWLVLGTLLRSAGIREPDSTVRFTEPLWPIGALLVISTNPLILHLNMSLMPDSLAISFVLLYFWSIFVFLFESEGSVGRLALVALSFIGLSLVRAEKVYFGAAMLGATLAVYIFWSWWSGDTASGVSKETGPRGRVAAKVVALVVVVGVATAAVAGLNRATRSTSSLKRPPFNVTVSFFSSVVWPHMAEIYPKLPPDVQRRISYQNAVEFDRQERLQTRFIWKKISTKHVLRGKPLKRLERKGVPPGVVSDLRPLLDREIVGEYPFLRQVEALIGEDGVVVYGGLILGAAGGNPDYDNPRETLEILNKIMKVSLQENWSGILRRDLVHFTEYLFSPYTFAYESSRLSGPYARASQWTISRMQLLSKGTIDLALAVSAMVIALATVLAVGWNRGIAACIAPQLVGLLIVGLVNSAVFSLVLPQTWHVRYALGSYVPILVLLVFSSCHLVQRILRRGPGVGRSSCDGRFVR